MKKRRLQFLGQLAMLAIVYIMTAKLGLMLDAVGGFATLVWPASGVALAALVRFGRKLWPGVAIGAFIVNLWAGAPVHAALGISVGNTLEPLLGALALRHLVGLQDTFDRLRHVVGLIVLAAMLSTVVSATGGVMSLYLTGTLRPLLLEAWFIWWLGDAIGVIVVGSLLLTWAGKHRCDRSLQRMLEVAVLGAALLAILACVFLAPPLGEDGHALQRHYLIFPIIFLVALRLGLCGATVATFVTSVVAVTSTVFGVGPFVNETLLHGLLSLQVYMVLVGATALLIGGTISEWVRVVRARDDLLAVVSHDLKNPLNAIQMGVEAIKHAAPDAGDARLQKYFVLMQRSTDRMNAIIRDLLDAAAIDVGKLSLSTREEDAGEIVGEAVELARPVAIHKGHALSVHGPIEKLWVVCDRERVLRVLANLIENAIKYTPEGGSIRVTMAPKDHAVCFSVADTGVGMSQAELRRIFEPYFRATPHANSGSGLGLFIAKAVVEAHGGRIWAESEVGIGSSVHFTLPLSSGGTS